MKFYTNTYYKNQFTSPNLCILPSPMYIYSLFKAKKYIFAFEDRSIKFWLCKKNSDEVDPILLELKSQRLKKNEIIHN